MFSKSEKRIANTNNDNARRSSVNAPVNQHKSFDVAPPVRTDSFGMPKEPEMPNRETVEWQNHSFGDSEDHRIFESKRLIDTNHEGSDNENDAANFSFCESDKKSQPRASNIAAYESNNNLLQGQFDDEDMNLFSTPIAEERQSLERLLKRPTTVIVPCYVDAGKFRSDCKVRGGKGRDYRARQAARQKPATYKQDGDRE